MKEIHTIIVPIDFLEHTDQIVEFALYISKQLNSELRFAHIVDPPHNYGGYEYPSLGALTDEIMKHAEKQMKELIIKNKNNCLGCDGKVLKGNIVDSIIKYAKDEKADLIIIGTHGRKGLDKMWLGSVAERVIKRAPCPTLTWNPYKATNK